MAAFNSSLWLIRLFLQLHLFLQTPDAKRIYAKVQQKPKFLSTSIGETITLHCQLTRAIIRPTVKWYKGSQALDTGTDSRVRRVHPGSQTDFSILIPHIERQDAGTYYCTREFFGLKRKGKGSVVSVVGEGHLFSSSAFWIGFILNKVIAAFLLLCLFLRKQHSKMNP